MGEELAPTPLLTPVMASACRHVGPSVDVRGSPNGRATGRWSADVPGGTPSRSFCFLGAPSSHQSLLSARTRRSRPLSSEVLAGCSRRDS